MIAGDRIGEDRKEGDRDDGNSAMRMQVRPDRRNLIVSVAAIGLLAIPAVAVALLPQLATQESEATFRDLREIMVREQLVRRGIKDKAVLTAFRKVPRHRFVPAELRSEAYSDGPLPIGNRQTISQPEIVAMMTELIKPDKTMRVLEIGTGSGYQAAILAECVKQVDSIEVVEVLGKRAEAVLRELGYRNVKTRIGDGYEGWPDRAPYDAIILTAAPPHDIPQPLLDQLRPGGTLVAPIGRSEQRLVRVTKTEGGYKREVIADVRFVPMTGKAQEKTRP
jgi:protein-L-isoaspartate(D-aspartate) O-methyltransferase